VVKELIHEKMKSDPKWPDREISNIFGKGKQRERSTERQMSKRRLLMTKE